MSTDSPNNRLCKLTDVIDAVRREELGCYHLDGRPKASADRVDFDVYWKNVPESPDLEDEVYVGEPSPIDDDVPDDDLDLALQPNVVRAKGWWLAFSGELFEDVIAQALRQKPSATNAELLRALNHYSARDTYLPLEP
ncbi:MAG: hypothetical protein AAF533_26600 [Acidobacteriota bacterium]